MMEQRSEGAAGSDATNLAPPVTLSPPGPRDPRPSSRVCARSYVKVTDQHSTCIYSSWRNFDIHAESLSLVQVLRALQALSGSASKMPYWRS